MTEMNLKETFKIRRDIDSYIEQWENAKPEEDPLLKSWKDFLDENRLPRKKAKRRRK
jgi:aminoglycoside phosphotransferase (APT) family kinase protein